MDLRCVKVIKVVNFTSLFSRVVTFTKLKKVRVLVVFYSCHEPVPSFPKLKSLDVLIVDLTSAKFEFERLHELRTFLPANFNKLILFSKLKLPPELIFNSNLKMNVENILEEDYETQHFGFHPRVFLDGVYNTFYENVHEALNQMKSYLTENYKNVSTPSSIATGTEDLFKIMLKELDKAIDKLELYVGANIFTIPNHVTLPEDEVHISNPCTKEEEAELDEEIEQIKKKIQEERIRQYFLKRKLTEQKAVIIELISFKKQLESMFTSLLQTKVKKGSIQETLENFVQLLQQIKEPLTSSVDS